MCAEPSGVDAGTRGLRQSDFRVSLSETFSKTRIRSANMSLISVFTDQIRPDRGRRYEAIIVELAAEARKKREEWRWTAHQVGFGSLARIYYVSEHPDYADLEKHGDVPALFERVLGVTKGRKLLDEANECLVSNQRTLGVQRLDLSYVKEPAQGVAPLASLALFRARPGAQHLVEELLRQIAEAIPKCGEPGSVAAAQSVIGDMLGYWTVRPLQKLADLDRQSVGRALLIKAFGKQEGERIFRNGLEGVDRLEREITVYREDLSNPR
jgi:hypothetical protein